MAMNFEINAKDNASVSINNINKSLNLLGQNFINLDQSFSYLDQSFSYLNQNFNHLDQNFINASKQTNIFNESLGFLETVATNVASDLAIMALSTLKDLGKEMIESYTSASKLSESIGITAESIVGLRYAADLSKVGAEEMDKNLVTLSKTIADAASGSNEAADSFEKMCISVKNADGTTKDSNQVLMEMADVFKGLPAGVERASLAVEVFGENGASMVNMLKDGSDGLREITTTSTCLS